MGFAELVAATDRAAQQHLGGVPVTYQPAAGAPVEVTGIFDAQYEIAKGTPEAGVGVLSPVVFLRLEDLPVDPEDDDPTLTIGGVDYRTVGPPQPDGMNNLFRTVSRFIYCDSWVLQVMIDGLVRRCVNKIQKCQGKDS